MVHAEPSVEELEGKAVEIHEKILLDEKALSSRYWHLGKALKALNSRCPHGEWLARLTGLGIQRTRWERAKAIHETFASPDDCDSLSVTEAYEKRERKQKQNHSSRKTKNHLNKTGVKRHQQDTDRGESEEAQGSVGADLDSAPLIGPEIPPTADELSAFVEFVGKAFTEDVGTEELLKFAEACGNLDRAKAVKGAAVNLLDECFCREIETLEVDDA